MSAHKIQTQDGFSLGLNLFEPSNSPRALVVISTATGMRQSYYRRFAEFLVEAGYAALTYDYRGIGESIPAAGIRSFSANMRDWGQIDMPAVFDWAEEKFPDLPKLLVGHSFGGVGLVMSPQSQNFDALVLVSSPNFYYKNGDWRYRLKLAFVTQFYIPLSERFAGVFVGKYLGLGDDLPRGIMSEWAKWIYDPAYIGATAHPLYFDHITAPILAFSFTDDELAQDYRFFEQLLNLYSQAEVSHYHFDPSTFNLPHLGHNGFFREHFTLWDEILTWWDSLGIF